MDDTMAEVTSLNLLIVDDDDGFRQALVHRFLRRGYQVQDAANAEQAMDLAQRQGFDVAIFDVVLPGMSGLALLEWYIQGQTDCEVIMLTGQGTIETAVEAMKLGAYDYVTKPVPLKDLETLVGKAYERRQLKKENEQLKLLLRRSLPEQVMIGQSPAMREIYRLVERAGPSDKAILIQGESGTGKELVARALHRHSRRADRPMVVINCAALPESLLESELFGHEKGAFTGAVSAKPGLFEVADGGTLFIDEIGEMPAALQAKLLRVLEDGSLRRIGSIKERRVNVRLLTATNCDLARQVVGGGFREDLYYRINVMSLELPPLRQRAGDIPLLLRHFLGPGWEIEPPAVQMLERYDWPGNVRQLINAVERARIMADGRVLRVRDFPRETTEYQPLDPLEALQRYDDLATLERAKIVEVLRRERGNKTRAARSLGIDRRKLYRLVEKHRIESAELERALA
ncbi:MAG: sigma-54 dependent transcriptional regulator [Pirellulaceae bacterium]|jgi:DNA-binding NtrC family response regulator|nr:sigma-54 dependent transcriptional regulator [Pirellulaceae bacterium]